jgi:hypothetical protein
MQALLDDPQRAGLEYDGYFYDGYFGAHHTLTSAIGNIPGILTVGWGITCSPIPHTRGLRARWYRGCNGYDKGSEMLGDSGRCRWLGADSECLPN